MKKAIYTKYLTPSLSPPLPYTEGIPLTRPIMQYKIFVFFSNDYIDLFGRCTILLRGRAGRLGGTLVFLAALFRFVL